MRCTAQNGTPLQDCRDFVADDQAAVRSHRPGADRRRRIFACSATWRWPRATSAATRTRSSASAAPRPCSRALPVARRSARRVHVNRFRRLPDQCRGAGSRRAPARRAMRRLRRIARRAGLARPGGLRRQRADRALARHRQRPSAARQDGRQRRRRQRPRPDGASQGDGTGSDVHPGARPLPHLQGRRHPPQRLPVLPCPRRCRGLRCAGAT